MIATVSRSPRFAADLIASQKLSRMQGQELGPADVARVLNAAGGEFVLVGAYAIAGYNGRPRATVDVDVVASSPKKATAALKAAFPDLQVEDHPVVTRFKRSGEEVIDVIKPASAKLFRRLLNLNRVIKMGGEAVRVPTLEGA